ncbi:hypothetical protein MY11210_008724 [Beauveria gryllotalpidicola]
MPNSTADMHPETRRGSHIDTDTGNEHDSEMQSRKMTLHMENQERAYVAASRRTDRSLEARYQSALMASQVHKRRTGKALRVTHQIVRDEEMYEEEDQGLPSPSRFSQNGDRRRRTLSQTDAYIAALIARKSGMQNFFEQNHALFTSPPSNSATWTEQPPATPAYSCCSVPPVNQPVGCEVSSNDSATLSKMNDKAESNRYKKPGHGLDHCFAESTTLPGSISHAHTSSSGSSLSDMLSYDSNYIFGSSSNDRTSSPESCDLRLEDCLVGTDGEDLLNFAPNELLVGYDSQFNKM